MGLAALRRILEPQPAALADFRGRIVAADANNLLWMFVTAMREPPLGPDGRPIAHVIGLANRLKLYAQEGIRAAWVFDGPQPRLKDATLAGRTERLEATGGPQLQRSDIRDAKELLTALGIPWLVAPGESDAQCAHFARTGQAWAAVTQDYDAALHGAPRIARNLAASATRTPEMIDLERSLADAHLTREALVDVAILIGTDYNVGVKGVGPVKAMKLVREHGDLHGALAALGVEMPEADEVRALFLAHPVDPEARLEWRAPDEARVRELLGAAGLSAARADELVRLHV